MKFLLVGFCVSVAGLLMVSVSAKAQLGDALNATNLTWTTSGTGGGYPWIAETTTTHDGVSAAQSGSVAGTSSSSILQTTVTGPGTLTFWCKLSSLGSVGSLLSFKVGGVTLTNIYDWADWQQQTFYLGAGTQTLQWVYSLYFSQWYGLPEGWVDQVSFTPGTTAPFITSQPPSQSQVQGLNASISVGVLGTPPFSYQWQFNSTNIPGATNFTLIATNVQAANLGNYGVVVTNIAGSIISSNASLGFGQVTAWGVNNSGQTTVPLGTSNVLAMAGGGWQSVLLKTDGTVTVWGSNYQGQTNVPVDLTNVLAIAAGFYHILALKSDGTVVAWGDNSFNQTNVPADLTNVVAIAAGNMHSLALKADGTVTAWGYDDFGLTNVPAGLTNVVAIAGGTWHSLVLKADGTVTTWGGSSATNIPVNLTNVVAIAARGGDSMALKTDGTVVAWGNNSYGQTNVPANLTSAVAIALGMSHDLALKSDGTVVAWGINADGRTNVPAGLTNVVVIAAGGYHSLALVGSGPPVLHASLINPVMGTNGFSLTLPTQSGRVYRLEYKNSLGDADWTALPLVAGSGGNLVLADSTATNSQRFYRVRRW
jgi:hypothetical protein